MVLRNEVTHCTFPKSVVTSSSLRLVIVHTRSDRWGEDKAIFKVGILAVFKVKANAIGTEQRRSYVLGVVDYHTAVLQHQLH